MAKITSKITSIETDVSATKSNRLNTLTLGEAIQPEPHTASTPNQPVTTQSPATTPPLAQTNEPRSGWIRVVTIISLLLWICATAVICISLLDIKTNAKTYTPLQWAGVAGMFIGPLAMILVAAYSFKQLAKLSVQSHYLSNAMHALSQPDKAVIRKSEVMASAVAQQIDFVNDKMNAALGRLSSLEDVLKAQNESLAHSNVSATQTAGQITNSMQKQKDALDSISGTFDERMGALSLMITSHTDKLASATQHAEQKIKEARISVEGATSKINSASDIVRSNTIQATSTLNASHADINSLGDIIRERSSELDSVYKKHAGDLTAMIEHLRDEQQNLGAVLEERLTKMRDLSLSAQASAESLTDASNVGKETIEALAQSAGLADSAVKSRFKEMQDMVKYSTDHAQSISDKAAQRVKNSLELTRKEIARIENDMADLQDRISKPSHKSLELIPENILHEEDSKKTSSQKRKWTRLKLKPVEDTAPLPAISLDSNQEEPTPLPKEAPTPKAEITLPDTIADIDNAPKTPTRQDMPIYLHVDAPQISPYSPSLSKKDMGETSSYTPADTSLKKDTLGNVDAVRRSAPLEPQKKPKKGFSLWSMFSKRDSQKIETGLDDASFGIVDAKPTPPTPLPLMAEDNNDDTSGILATLTQLGLAPNAVVDDGCVILASNDRASSGHETMSRTVADRLKGPVEHLAKALSIDTELSRITIEFASQYDQRIEQYAQDREAVRIQLESEKGRAYLLCDAALNYGRV